MVDWEVVHGTSIYIARSIAEVYEIAYDEVNCNEVRIRSDRIEEQGSDELSIFPNPSNDVIHVRSLSNIDEIIIYDTSMKIVLKSIDNSVDVSTLKSGIYICKDFDKGVLLGTQKLIVIK